MKLDAQSRKHIKKALFGLPEKAPGSGSYPMPDRAHAANAKARAAQFASPKERKRIDAKANKILKKKPKQKVRRDSRGDTYKPGAKYDSAGDRIMGNRDSRGDRLR